MKPQVFLVFVAFLPLFFNCKRQCTVSCQTMDLGVVIKGYTDAEVDTVEVRKFTKNSSFKTMSSVTIMRDVNFTGIGRIDKFHDWEIFIPATNQAFRFSEITDQNKETITADCKSNPSCINQITSFKLNGVTHFETFGTVMR